MLEFAIEFWTWWMVCYGVWLTFHWNEFAPKIKNYQALLKTNPLKADILMTVTLLVTMPLGPLIWTGIVFGNMKRDE